MVTFGEKRHEYLQNNQILDRLFWWYAEQNFPSERFDDMSPLCHTSVPKWALAAGATMKSDAKIERCAKVDGEVACKVTLGLNEFFAGTWTAPDWKPSAEIEHCVRCRGPDVPAQKVRKWNQQGHMECLTCHSDHPA